MKDILKNKWIVIVLVLILGIVIGKMMGGGSSSNDEGVHSHNEAKAEIWTCSMHPQIQQDKPGQCPLCGMDLIPLDNSIGEDDALPDEVAMSASAMKLAEIQTYIVKKEKPEKEIRLLGKIAIDERRITKIPAHFHGRIENLYINFTGEKVAHGQVLADVYSPGLIEAQKELIIASKNKNFNPAMYESIIEKLRNWKIPESEIKKIEKHQVVFNTLKITAHHAGIVTKRNVAQGDHVDLGDILFETVDLSKVWVLFDAYENDIPWIKIGDELSIELKSVPGKIFTAKVSFIDPFINPKTRVASVRVELTNSKGLLKPDMFANGVITSKLPIDEDVILIPKSAALWTGKRAVVYVKVPNRDHNSFIYREIILGEDAGDFYVVKQGLEEGEEIATNGVFKIDAAAQLAGKKSMMNPTGGKSSTGHNHGGDDNKEMDMSGMNMEVMIDQSKVPSKFKKQLGVVVESYLPLKSKLAKDDAKIQTNVKAIQKALKKVDMSLVMEDAHNIWMKTLKAMNKDLKRLSKAVNIDEQRSIFLTISQSLSDATQKLGVKMKDDKPLYLEFCPMANDNNGGYWLSTEKKIKNPYFGSKMLKCGSVKETLTKN